MQRQEPGKRQSGHKEAKEEEMTQKRRGKESEIQREKGQILTSSARQGQHRQQQGQHKSRGQQDQCTLMGGAERWGSDLTRRRVKRLLLHRAAAAIK